MDMIFNHLAHISSLGYFKNIFSIYFFKYSCINNFFYCCRDWVLGSDVERLSFCELEVDVQASDILNKLEIGGNASINVKPNGVRWGWEGAGLMWGI